MALVHLSLVLPLCHVQQTDEADSVQVYRRGTSCGNACRIHADVYSMPT